MNSMITLLLDHVITIFIEGLEGDEGEQGFPGEEGSKVCGSVIMQSFLAINF